MDLKRFGFIAIIILILILIVVLVGRSTVPTSTIVISMLATMIAVATPLTLGALCGLFCERAGVVNIGIEGMMLASAFFGWFGAISHEHNPGIVGFTQLIDGGIDRHRHRRIVRPAACSAFSDL